MRKLYAFLGIAAVMSWGILASSCGHAPPSFAEAESNLNSPTGTVDKNTTVTAWGDYQNGQKSLEMPGLKYGNMPKFMRSQRNGTIPFHEYLNQAGIPGSLLYAMAPYLPLKNDYSLQNIEMETGENAGLRIKQIDIPDVGGLACVKFSGNASGGGSGEITIDLGCTKEGSGQIIIRVQAQGGAGSGEIVSQIFFNNACDNQGNCVNGAMQFKVLASVSGNVRCIDQPGFRCGEGQTKSMVLFTMKMTVKSGGETVDVKQAMRILMDASAAGAAMSLEVLVWIQDTTGAEASVVIVMKAKISAGESSASFSVVGKNGSFECTTKGKSGECKGTGEATGTFSW
jgi:hypothetical protein